MNQSNEFQRLEHKMMRREDVDEEPTTQAPVFTTSMKSVEIREGQRAHFDCRLIPVSDPKLVVEWLHNGKPIKQGSRFREGHDFGFVSLDIMHVYPEDAGTYTCRATNQLGQAVISANLTIKANENILKETLHQAAMDQINYLEADHIRKSDEDGFTTQVPAFTQQLKPLTVNEGMPAHYEAKLVPVGDPHLRVDWFKDGKPVQASNRLSTLHDFGFVALDLKYTRQDDAGTYTCQATNQLGQAHIQGKLTVIPSTDGPNVGTMHGDALQKIAYLEQKQPAKHTLDDEGVTSAPNFVVQLQGKTKLVEGQNIHIECRIEPYPDSTLNVEWFHNGKPLPFGNRIRTSYDFGFAALDISGAYPQDSGRYILRATNALGSAESHLDINVACEFR